MRRSIHDTLTESTKTGQRYIKVSFWPPKNGIFVIEPGTDKEETVIVTRRMKKTGRIYVKPYPHA